MSHHTIQVAFDDVDGMLRWQVPIRWLRARVTLISRYQLANFAQMNRYIDPHRVITVPVVLMPSQRQWILVQGGECTLDTVD